MTNILTIGRVAVPQCTVYPSLDTPETDEYLGVEENEEDEGDESYDVDYFY